MPLKAAGLSAAQVGFAVQGQRAARGRPRCQLCSYGRRFASRFVQLHLAATPCGSATETHGSRGSPRNYSFDPSDSARSITF